MIDEQEDSIYRKKRA